jgi:acyl-CoA synthetase (AMP-forming)/AMP-acid ligase II
MTTVYQVLRESVSKHASRPFLHIPAVASKSYADEAIDYSYQEMADLVEAQKQIYSAAGYGLGHRVALVLDNRGQFFVHWFALNALGVSVVPVNSEMTTDEIAYLLGHSESCLVIALPEHIPVIAEALASAQIKLPLLDTNESGSIPAAPTAALAGVAGADTECALLYTSGSTGKPKGCVLPNEYFIVCAQWYRDMGGLCPVEEGVERLLTPLPLVHMNAMACSSMVMLMTGGCIVQLDRFHPGSWWQTVRDSDATIIHYLGVMPAMFLNTPEHAEDKNHRVKFGFGAGINPRHHEPFEARFNIPLMEAWAMTESGCGGAIIANREPRHIGTSCIGWPGDAIEFMLVDEQGIEVARGDPGELLVRTRGDDPRRGFFVEYLKNPEATAEAWAGDYLHTGDVVRQGDDGQLHFVDRRKNVIRRSGENISALEVEATLSEHPMIAQVAVAPVPDEIRGDEVMAAIILQAGIAFEEQVARQIFQHCYDSLVYFKAPGYIAFLQELPLTASQKPKRAELKILCRELVERKACFDLRDMKRRQHKRASA